MAIKLYVENKSLVVDYGSAQNIQFYTDTNTWFIQEVETDSLVVYSIAQAKFLQHQPYRIIAVNHYSVFEDKFGAPLGVDIDTTIVAIAALIISVRSVPLVPDTQVVDTFAELPPVGDHTNEVWYVRQQTGVWILNTRKQSGDYISDGVNWIHTNNPLQYFTDDQLTFKDDGDQTKQLGFQLGQISPGQRRIATWPDKNGVVATVNDLTGLNVKQVFEEADFGTIIPATRIDPTPNTRFILMNPVTQTLPFLVATGANMEIVTTSRSENIITYTHVSEPMFQGIDVGTVAIFDTVIDGNNTGTLLDIDGGVISFKFPDFNRWKSLGTVKNLTDFFAPGVVFEVIENGLVMVNCASATIVDCLILAFDGNAFNVFEIIGIRSGSIQIYDNIMTSDIFPKLCRVDAAFSDVSRLVIRGNNVKKDQLFDTTGATGTFTAVADNSIGATGIDGVSDSSGMAQFNHSGTSPLLGSTVTISGFITNTSYNVTGVVSDSNAASFELENISFGTDEVTGSYLMNGITVTSVAHGLLNGEGLILDVDNSTDYNGRGHIIYNVQANSFDVDEIFTSTHTGNWSTEGIDQTNQRVFSFNNPDHEDSHYIVNAFVNNNATANPAIVNNVFTDIAFGGVGLIEGSAIERWKLIDPIIGEFEYLGNEDSHGSVGFDFTVISAGGTVDFRFKWVHDIGAGYVDLPDPVEGPVAVGSESVSISKRFPLIAKKGDRIKPQITRNSGTSTITTTHATIYGDQ